MITNVQAILVEAQKRLDLTWLKYGVNLGLSQVDSKDSKNFSNTLETIGNYDKRITTSTRLRVLPVGGAGNLDMVISSPLISSSLLVSSKKKW